MMPDPADSYYACGNDFMERIRHGKDSRRRI